MAYNPPMNTQQQTTWLWLSLIVILLDQLSKQWIEATFQLYQSMAVFPGFNLILVYNEGAAFSFLSDQGGWQRWFFVILAIAFSIGLIIWLLRLSEQEKWISAAIALILGGAVGNVIDRILFGHVIDFLDVYYDKWHFPAFNIADSAISLGVGLILIDAVLFEAQRRKSNDASSMNKPNR